MTFELFFQFTKKIWPFSLLNWPLVYKYLIDLEPGPQCLQYLLVPLCHVFGVAAMTTRLTPGEPIRELGKTLTFWLCGGITDTVNNEKTICTRYPFKCDMGYRWHSDQPYQTSSIWLVRVPSKTISHENGCLMHILTQNTLKFKFHEKEKLIWKITNSDCEPQHVKWRQIRTVLQHWNLIIECENRSI